MWLKLLQAQNLRSFQKLDISLNPGVNVFYGDNGAGKTSILEAVDVLSRGKSFRSSKISNITTINQTELLLFAELISDDNHAIQVGVRSKNGSSELKLNREAVKRWSELASNLPLLDIHPESYLLVMGGPVERRKFLNWGMFHVEQGYSKLWSEYTKALKQRNFCLKSRDYKQARFWHQSLAEDGEKITQHLLDYTRRITPYIQKLASQFNFLEQFTLHLDTGWNADTPLFELLENELQDNDPPNSTLSGPHRSDLKINWNGKRFSQTSSRGQQKIISMIMKLAQADLLKDIANKSSIYLIDELPAELDQNHRKVALGILENLDSQILISAVSKDSIDCINTDAKWFHVKHGSVSSMV